MSHFSNYFALLNEEGSTSKMHKSGYQVRKKHSRKTSKKAYWKSLPDNIVSHIMGYVGIAPEKSIATALGVFRFYLKGYTPIKAKSDGHAVLLGADTVRAALGWSVGNIVDAKSGSVLLTLWKVERRSGDRAMGRIFWRCPMSLDSSHTPKFKYTVHLSCSDKLDKLYEKLTGDTLYQFQDYDDECDYWTDDGDYN